MTQLAQTPEPPYYAVIFTSLMSQNEIGYQKMAEEMEDLASQQDGYLGIETAREEIGISVSYWRDLTAIKKWKQQYDHQLAQQTGRKQWYQSYSVRIAKVEKQYGFERG